MRRVFKLRFISCLIKKPKGGLFCKYVMLTGYNLFLVYCRELAPGTVSLTGDRAQGDDNKHDSHYTVNNNNNNNFLFCLI